MFQTCFKCATLEHRTYFTATLCVHLVWPADEFARAVYVATGLKLSRHLVNIVFKIFDVDHDDQLSYKEFIGIMKDRLHRGSWVNEAGGSAGGCVNAVYLPFTATQVTAGLWTPNQSGGEKRPAGI